MLVEHRGKQPTVDPRAYVAPTAVLCGDVRASVAARRTLSSWATTCWSGLTRT
jgi:carbonic anhydrase/acetyltransferase-like protein (isoleucine patch superfamily)